MVIAAIHGFILAFPLIMPLGVQNVFIFNQGALQPRYSKVWPIVITAAFCDTLLISLAVTGVSMIVFGSALLRSLLLGIGTIFLVYMGWMTWKAGPVSPEEEETGSSPLAKKLLFTISISLFNPHAIIDTVGVIGTSSLNYAGPDRLAFTGATVTVSWLWFFGLSLAGRITGRLDRTGRVVSVINKVSALVMWSAAVFMLYKGQE